MKLWEKKEDCCGCTACKSVCPTSAITMFRDGQGFWYPSIDQKKCVQCGMCRRVCQYIHEKGSIFLPPRQEGFPRFYAAKHKNPQVVKHSSSGGFFTAVSDHLLARGGVIYGAAFAGDFSVAHIRGTTAEQRDGMRGSKYVQSRVGDAFLGVREDLEQGRPVLFTGTPCQVRGLRHFLTARRVPADGLILCDFICHGTPSSRLWEDYLARLKGRYGPLEDVEFRNKDRGWNRTRMKIRAGDRILEESWEDNPFYRLFWAGVCLAPGCYRCQCCDLHRAGDLTMADFWGAGHTHPRIDQGQGASLVLVNTPKGEKLLRELAPALSLEEAKAEEFFQPNLARPTARPPRTDQFWEEYRREGFDFVLQKYSRLSLPQRLVKKVAVPLLKKAGLYEKTARLAAALAGRDDAPTA